MNLVRIILDLLFSGDMLNKLSSFLGTDEQATEKAATAAVPTILSSLAGLAATNDGAHKLSSTLNNLDPSLLGSVTKMLSGDTSSVAQQGSNLLSSLFGDSLTSNIARAVGKFAGLDSNASKKLLALIGPAVLGTVASQWKSQGGGLGALTNLLMGQQKNIAAALPAGFSLASIPGLPRGDGALRAAGQAARRAAAATEDATVSALKWIGPLAGILLIALALWYFVGRGPAGPNVAKNAADKAVAATSDAAQRASTAVTALKPTLPALPEVPDITSL